MVYVVKAQYVDQYKIELTFNNNKTGIIDLHDVIQNDTRPIFKELLEIERFKKFKVEMDTLVWENGLDLAPEFLYEKIQN